MTGDPRLAENVFQETMIRAWRAADALSTSTHPVRTWLFATCRGVVAEQARRRNVPPPPMGDGLPVDLRRVTSRTGQR
jgi:RNA polymerase sigma-70 factor (ECF subfamily)